MTVVLLEGRGLKNQKLLPLVFTVEVFYGRDVSLFLGPSGLQELVGVLEQALASSPSVFLEWF